MKSKIAVGLQVFFGLLLLTSAVGKLLDNRGFALVIDTYQLLPVWSSLVVALTFSLFELGLALLIFSGRSPRASSAGTIVLHVTYLTLASVTLARGIALTNCGCFGVFWARPLGVQTIIEDLVLLGLSILFFITSKRGQREFF